MSEQKQKGITRETLKFVFKTAWKERPSVFLVYLMKFISEFASKMQNAIMAKLIIDELVLMIAPRERGDFRGIVHSNSTADRRSRQCCNSA